MRRCVRSNEYQIGRMTPLSVAGGLFEFGFSRARSALVGPGSLAERFCSPFNTSALVSPKAVLNPIAPALIACCRRAEERATLDQWLFGPLFHAEFSFETFRKATRHKL